MFRTVAALISLALILSLTLVPAVRAEDSPKLAFEKTEIVFPFIKEGESVKAEFPFTNQGKMNLIIDKVSPSCGCTVAQFTEVTTPGAKGKVLVNLDTSGIHGAFRKTAVVSSNDPSQPFITLVLLGETVSRIKVDKGRRLEVKGCLGTDLTTVATLTDPDDKPLLITGVENPMSDYLSAEVTRMPGGKSYQLTLKALAKEPLQFAGPIYLKIPGSKKQSLFVLVDVKGPFMVRPQQLYFGGLRKNAQTLTRSIMIKRACAPQLKVDEILYNKDLFEVKEVWQKNGEELFLEVTPRLDKLPAGPFDEKMQIAVGGKAFPVRLKGVVQ